MPLWSLSGQRRSLWPRLAGWELRLQTVVWLQARHQLALVLLPPIIDQLSRIAPGIRLRVRRLEDQPYEDVEHGRIDMLIAVASNVTGQLEWRPITRENWSSRITPR